MFEKEADSLLGLVIVSAITQSLLESYLTVLANLMSARVIEGLYDAAFREVLLELLRDRDGSLVIGGTVAAVDDYLSSRSQCENG